MNYQGGYLEFVDISIVLGRNGLKQPELDILYPDTLLYSAAIFQPSGTITGNDDFVGNVNTQDAHDKHISFFQLAKEQSSSLAVCPEYSCPWRSIRQILDSDLFPARSSLWVVGAEAITPADLEQFREHYRDRFEILYEDVSDRRGRFLDPVCYMFLAQNQDNEERPVLLIQFKTNPMGDTPHHFERDRLIPGRAIYVLHSGGPNSIRLITFICSDVLGITNDQIDHILTRSLIIHIQLNPNPRSDTFARYRKFCFDAIDSDCEVMTINWAENISCAETNPTNWGNISGSGLYFKSQKADLSDDRINRNHIFGLYFTYLERHKTYVYFLNYCEGVYLFQSTKPWQHYGANQQAGRTGPDAIGVRSWNSEMRNWSTHPQLEDRFLPSCEGISGDFNPLLQQQATPINIERLLSVSHGLVSDQNWFKAERQIFFQIDGSEIVNRISFAQDPHPSARTHREKYLRLFSVLSHIVSTGTAFPTTISNLSANSTLGFSITEPIRNLHGLQGEAPATVVYLGENPNQSDVVQTFTNLQLVLSQMNKDRHRVVIWYRSLNGETRFYPEVTLPNADDDPNDNLALITRS